MTRWPEPLDRAYRACMRLARDHYENFPVASWLIPRDMRPHVAALYAFARVADDVADEGDAAPEVRRARLREWHERLRRAAEGPVEASPSASTHDLIFVALSHSIRSLDLPVSLFEDLLSAFGQDTMTVRYASWPDVLDYCRRSANPVGRLVLRIAGYGGDALDRSSDALCTALQLTNFWQDFGRDWRAGRLYVPREVIDGGAAAETDLSGARLSDRWVRAIDRCVAVTRGLFERGRAVCDLVGGRLRLELRLTWLGGMCILDRVERARFDLMTNRPTLSGVDVPVLAWRALRWKPARS